MGQSAARTHGRRGARSFSARSGVRRARARELACLGVGQIVYGHNILHEQHGADAEARGDGEEHEEDEVERMDHDREPRARH